LAATTARPSAGIILWPPNTVKTCGLAQMTFESHVTQLAGPVTCGHRFQKLVLSGNSAEAVQTNELRARPYVSPEQASLCKTG